MKNFIAKNAISNIVQMLIGIALMFILYRCLSIRLGMEELGLWSVVLATASASKFADLGLSISVTRFVARALAKDQHDQAGKVVETGVLTFLIGVPILMSAIYPLIVLVLKYIFIEKGLAQALKILPFALISIWLIIIASVIQSGLDGCQRMVIRAVIASAIQTIYVFTALFLVTDYGLIGLAWAQVVQGVLLVIVNWYVLRLSLLKISIIPSRWSGPVFYEMLKYGSNVQLSSLMMMFFDPLTKAMISKYGGLSAAGYFEIANQVVIKARSIIIAANQAIIPKVASITDAMEYEISKMYITNIRILVFITVPIFTFLIFFGGTLSNLILGSYHKDFIFFLNLSAIAWCCNTLSVAAYFINIGSGNILMNTKAHILMGLINITLGWKMGEYYGANGVILAYAISLIVGSIYLVLKFQYRNNILFKDLDIKELNRLLILCIILSSTQYFLNNINLNSLVEISKINIISLILIIYIIYIIWINPLRKYLWHYTFNERN